MSLLDQTFTSVDAGGQSHRKPTRMFKKREQMDQDRVIIDLRARIDLFPLSAGSLTLHYTPKPIDLRKRRHPCRDHLRMHTSSVAPQDLLGSLISPQVYTKTQALLSVLLPAGRWGFSEFASTVVYAEDQELKDQGSPSPVEGGASLIPARPEDLDLLRDWAEEEMEMGKMNRRRMHSLTRYDHGQSN